MTDDFPTTSAAEAREAFAAVVCLLLGVLGFVAMWVILIVWIVGRATS